MFVRHEPLTTGFVKQLFQYALEGLEPRGARRRSLAPQSPRSHQ
jgi:hypothetical protein